METRRLGPRKTNVELRAVAVQSRGDYKKQQALHVVTFRNFRVREELFVDYGTMYSLEQSSIRDRNERTG